jgi:hypothetical protein
MLVAHWLIDEILTNHLCLSNYCPKNLPALCKSCLGLEPVTRMQEILDRVDMAIPHRNSAVKFSSSIVIFLGQVFDRHTKLALDPARCLAVDVLD